MWRLVHQWSVFCCLTVFWLFLTVFDEWYTVPIVKSTQDHWRTVVTGLPRLYQQCTNAVPIVKNSQKQSKDSQKTVKTAKMTIGVPIITCLPTLYQQCTNSVPIVKNSQKQSKHSQNSTKMTIGVLVVTCLPRLYQPCTNSVPKTVKRQSKQQKWPLVHQSSQVYQECTYSVTIVYQSSTRT